MPISVGLNSSNRTYETSLGLTGGWTGKVPLKLKSFKVNCLGELNLGLKTLTQVYSSD